MKKNGEYVDLYTSEKKLTGKKVFREKGNPSIVPNDNYIIVVLAIMVNSKGEYLFQKTSARKGGLWALSGGHVKAGQTSLEAIKEELNFRNIFVVMVFVFRSLLSRLFLMKDIMID